MVGKPGSSTENRAKQSMRVSLVIPAMNEAKNLPHVLPRIPDIVDEIIMVDGHSTDVTREIALQLRPDIKLPINDG